MKTLKLCLLASLLLLVQSVQALAQVKVRTVWKHNPGMEKTTVESPKQVERTITWFSQDEQELKVLNLESPNLNKEFNRMVDEMDRLYHGPQAQPKQDDLELGRAEGKDAKLFLVKCTF